MERNSIIILGLIAVIMALVAGMFLVNGEKTQTSHIDILGNGTVPEGGKISANLSSNGTVLKDKPIHISVLDDKDKEVFSADNNTTSKGLAKFTLKNVSSGNYTVKVTFDGDKNYTSSYETMDLKIVKKEVPTNTSSEGKTTSSSAQSGNPENDGYYEDGVWYFYDEETGGYYRVADFEGEGYEVSDEYGNWVWTDADWNIYGYGNIYDDEQYFY